MLHAGIGFCPRGQIDLTNRHLKNVEELRLIAYRNVAVAFFFRQRTLTQLSTRLSILQK